MVEAFRSRGWIRFPFDPDLAEWVAHALPAARAAVDDPALAHWRECEGTWFVGVDALDNDAQGRVAGSGPLTGVAMRFISDHLGMLPLHRAQVSVIHPGYPRPRRGEGAAAFRYRRNRDAAHVDGLKPTGPDRRRKLAECHAWILGLPLTVAGPDAAPLVVWEGSHRIIRDALAAAFAGHPAGDLADVDVTEAYQDARREVFGTCRRVPLPAAPGEAYVIDRLALHGVAPWAASARAGPDGRMIAYFRPELPGGIAQWLDPS